MLERCADAIPPLEHARVLIPTFSMNVGFLAAAHVRAGNRERGAEMLRALDGALVFAACHPLNISAGDSALAEIGRLDETAAPVRATLDFAAIS